MKFTIKEFHEQYPDDAACLQDLFQRRFGHFKSCPECERETKFHRVSTRACFVCQWCGYQIYPMQGTPFEKTTTPLKHWFYAIYLMTATRSGVSAKELERQLGVTYKTAWRMNHQIRLLMAGSGAKLKGMIEADETFVGGLSKNMHSKKREAAIKGTGGSRKTPIAGLVERGGHVKAKVVENVKAQTLLPNIVENVEAGATVCTDEWCSYNQLQKAGFDHQRVCGTDPNGP